MFYLNGEAKFPLVGVPYATMSQRRGKSTPVVGLFSPSLNDVWDPNLDAMPVIISGVEGAVTLNIDSADFAAFGSPADDAWDGEALEAGGIAIQKFAALTLVDIWARLGDGSTKVGMAQQIVVAANFLINTSLTAGLDLGTARLVALQLPAGWEGTQITFDASHDGDTYAPLFGSDGQEKVITVAASRFVVVNPGDFLGIRRLKVRSGLYGAGVNQTTARTILLITQP